jgi:hypothetical protein
LRERKSETKLKIPTDAAKRYGDLVNPLPIWKIFLALTSSKKQHKITAFLSLLLCVAKHVIG